METIKNIVLSASAVTLVYSVIFFILPEANIKKTLRSVIYISLVLTLILTVIYFADRKSITMPDIEEKEVYLDEKLTESLNDLYINSAEEAVRKALENKLKEEKINFKSLRVLTNISDNSRIYISKVEIRCDGEDIENCRRIAKEMLPDSELVIYE